MPPFSFLRIMGNPILRKIVRTRFSLTSRKAVERQTKAALKEYLQLANGLNEITGSTPVTVPRMLGVDEDMRGWSFFMLLRHNTIVNHAISANISRLALGEPEPTQKFDVKKDVMPDVECGIEQVALFKASVISHLDSLKSLGCLKGTRMTKHPLFGSFDAHKWNCMLAFHLKIHLKQASLIRQAVRPDSD